MKNILKRQRKESRYRSRGEEAGETERGKGFPIGEKDFTSESLAQVPASSSSTTVSLGAAEGALDH